MPTPFMHLQVAEQIQSALADESAENALLSQITADLPAFYLGSVAPDYQIICDVPRENTHFYSMPPQPDNMGYDRMLQTYPQLANAHALSPPHAVFIAAYAAHLLLDLIWLREILYPLFLQSQAFSDRQERHLSHLAALTYLDSLAYAALPVTAGVTLAAVQPDNWLPFAANVDVIRWQTLLARQLLPGGHSETISIFAGRLGLTADEFRALLSDQEWLQQHLFTKIPLDRIQARLDTAVTESVSVIKNYLNPQ